VKNSIHSEAFRRQVKICTEKRIFLKKPSKSVDTYFESWYSNLCCPKGQQTKRKARKKETKKDVDLESLK